MTPNTTNSPQQIEACPFCKSEDVHYQSDYGDESQFVCAVCDARGPMRRSYADALTAWNTRPSPQSDTREAVALADELIEDACSAIRAFAEGTGHSNVDYVAGLMRDRLTELVALRSTPNAGTEMLLREALQKIADHDGVSYRFGDEVRQIANEALAKIDASQSPTDNVDVKG